MIQIRNVPEDLHRAAKIRAANEGVTLSDLALRALEREMATPTWEEIFARIDGLPSIELEIPAAELIREDRDAR
jgi:plasmid stability protein